MPFTQTWVPSNGPETHSTFRQRLWERTPNWHLVKKLPKKDLPINGYETTLVSIDQQPYSGFVNTVWTDGSSAPVRSDWPFPNGVPLSRGDAYFNYYFNWIFTDEGWSDYASLKNEAFLKALLKASDAKTNISVALAEASKTSSTILDRASRTFKAYRAFRKGRLKEVADELGISRRNVHKTWLEYKYGWMPLLMDVKQSAEFFAQQALGGRPPSFVVVGKASRKGNWNREYTMGFTPIVGQKQRATLQGEQVVRVKLWLEIDNPQFQQLSQLGVTNPLLYAWEVIPFSFVFDWFCSVGDYLQGLTALHGITVKRSMWDGYTDYYGVSSIDDGLFIETGSNYVKTFKFDQNDQRLHARHYSRGIQTVDLASLRPPINGPYSSFSKLATSLGLMRTQAQRWAR